MDYAIYKLLYLLLVSLCIKVQKWSVFEKYLSNTPKYTNQIQIQIQIFHLVGFQIQIQIQIQIFAYLNTNTNTYLTPALLWAWVCQHDHLGPYLQKEYYSIERAQRKAAQCRASVSCRRPTHPSARYRSASAGILPLIIFFDWVFTFLRLVQPLEMSLQPLAKILVEALQWVTSSYDRCISVTKLLKYLQWDSRQERRRQQRLVFMYKILNHQVAVPANSIDLTYSSRPVRGDKNKKKLFQPRTNTTELLKSFVHITIPDWNSLPHSVAQSGTEDSFRCRLAAQPWGTDLSLR